jgi:CRISPR-associated protein Cas6
MYWQEEDTRFSPVVRDDVIDVACDIVCRTLPVDHAYPLSQAVLAVLPWLAGEPGAGVHTIHVADSGNGWMRPEGAAALLHLSRRTKLVLRLPKARLADAGALAGATLDVAGHPLQVTRLAVRPLAATATLFARYVVAADGDENAFLQAMAAELETLGIRPRKMLCGIERALQTPAGALRTRSLMLAELALEESVRLQERGLGPQRTLGCGLFLPHKDIRELRGVLD